MTRSAIPSDAIAAIEVVRRSISKSCTADHRNDPATLARWLANKTPETFRAWISNPVNFCVVEEADQRIQGVGLVRTSGEVLLFYVAPDFQRRGMGRRIHAALEAQAVDWSLPELQLESTAAARPFYESLGYRATGPSRPVFGVLRTWPYAKRLQPRRRPVSR